jgi:outer membrane protein insertion porin family/translocation and assembly module TamA
VTLANAINTTNSSWFARVVPFRWLGLGEKRYFSEQDFRYDFAALKIFYQAAGYPDVQIDTLIRRTPESVYITFRIREGEPIRVTSFQVAWLDSVPAWLRRLALRDLPLEQGDVFSRFAMYANADSIAHRLQDRGYPGARVLPGYRADKTAHTASVTLEVEPRIRAVISSVRVNGADRVDSSLIPRLMVARAGRRFSTGEMFDSQRNLYRSELFRYVSVGIDSVAYRSGPADSVPLVVQVTENQPRRIRGSLGFATSDCFRGSLGWAKRNFLGGGRVLDLSSRVSKVGVGKPLDWGLADGICGAGAEDTVGSASVNYGLTASVRQPGFLSPYNNLALSLYTERRSEFKVYLRREAGVSLAFTRDAARRRIPLSLAYTLSYGRTEATAANFCAFFNACTPDVLGPLQQNRVLATLTGTAALPRVNNPIDPTRGSLKSLEVTHSSRFIGSSPLQQFTRIVADAAWYRSLSRNVVLSWRLRGGVIFAPRVGVGTVSGAFIPPEHRFYAGGPNDVRGFERNELGPVVYVVPKTHVDTAAAHGKPIDPDSVRVAATGGNALGIGNVELRVPSPIFSSRLRLAAFVDAGTLWQRQAVSTPQLVLVRVTPGIGLRVVTPLGPARLDFAYNPYSLQSGALFQVDNRPSPVGTGALDSVPGRPTYVLDRRRNFTVHFAVGQPF